LFLGRILHFLVHVVATFMAKILKHPKVRDAAAANIVVAGIRKLCHDDPDLDLYLQQAARDTLTYQHLEQDDTHRVEKTSPRWPGILSRE
jgi:hypothetical protein